MASAKTTTTKLMSTAAAAAAASERPTLLFAHGGGLCKEAWEPIARRVLASPLLQRAPANVHSFDFPYHGSKRDESVKPRVFSIGPKARRVSHPISAWVATATQEVTNVVQQLRDDQKQSRQVRKAPLIGIGHSMGAVALWLTEVNHPGTFDGLILFEPMYGLASPDTTSLVDMLVGATLRREAHWPSREAANAHFAQFRNFATWDRESLAAYLTGALVEANNGDGSVSLACHPHIEAAIYCGYAGWLSAAESARPQCRVSFHGGERSPFYAVDEFEKMRAQSPHIYTLHPPMSKCSHALVMENPALAAEHIVRDLAELPAFASQQQASIPASSDVSSSSRL